jgi:hypothetical protein
MSDIQSVTYDDCFAVTPVATGNIWSEPVAGFLVTVAGNIQVVTARKTIITLTVLAGIIYPLAILSVLSGAATTATGIYAFTTASAPYRGLRPQ